MGGGLDAEDAGETLALAAEAALDQQKQCDTSAAAPAVKPEPEATETKPSVEAAPPAEPPSPHEPSHQSASPEPPVQQPPEPKAEPPAEPKAEPLSPPPEELLRQQRIARLEKLGRDWVNDPTWNVQQLQVRPRQARRRSEARAARDGRG
eukprot:1868595-Prymnesium_polylepis.1